ncbi:unnamed protein product [Linum tenue]|uniref:Uncharacterized protein n=1 Tax=Linum tenue TaxID=586396 RepID=A0AAV0I2T1_9ROSI|nr:unnamed protein product [Linum tenue]
MMRDNYKNEEILVEKCCSPIISCSVFVPCESSYICFPTKVETNSSIAVGTGYHNCKGHSHSQRISCKSGFLVSSLHKLCYDVCPTLPNYIPKHSLTTFSPLFLFLFTLPTDRRKGKIRV